MDYIVWVEILSVWVFRKFERACDVAEIVVLEFYVAVKHIGKMVLRLLLTSFVRGCSETLFLDDSSGIIERSTCDVALLARQPRNVKDKAVCWKFLTTANLDHLTWFDLLPCHWDESRSWPRDKKCADILVVDPSSDLNLSEFKNYVSNAHESKIERQGHQWKRHWNRLFSWRRLTRVLAIF